MRILTLVPPTSMTRTLCATEPDLGFVCVLSAMYFVRSEYISSSCEFARLSRNIRNFEDAAWKRTQAVVVYSATARGVDVRELHSLTRPTPDSRNFSGSVQIRRNIDAMGTFFIAVS